MSAQLLVHQRDVVARVERDEGVAAQPVLDDGTRELVEDLLNGASLVSRLRGRDAVNGRRLLRDLDARIRQPRGNLIGFADAEAVGGAVNAQDESGGTNARRLGVKTHPRVVDPAHDCSCSRR